MKCFKCHEEIPYGADNCPKCGTKISKFKEELKKDFGVQAKPLDDEPKEE